VTELASGQGVQFSEEDFYQGKVNIPQLAAALPKDPRFLQDSGFQGVRSMRLGIGLQF
jgi:hypothetical protein